MSTYLDVIIGNVPRIVGHMDRNEKSPTYGCFDRQFWHYKVIDFSCARMQEAALTLALLYSKKLKNNPYYKNTNIKKWSIAAINFWRKIQDRDGSFSEWYPHEHSFVATAFTTYAVTEACLNLNYFDDGIERSVKKSADWLCKNNETQASNQCAGSVIALYNSYLLTSETKYKKEAERKLKYLIENQNSEGWFPEYGGADIGYSSVLLDYLMKYYEKTNDKKVLQSCKKLVEFLGYFVHPDNTFGGEYGSRNTEYIIPSGIEKIIDHNTSAKRISESIRIGLSNGLNIDDRYLLYNGYYYVQAADEYKPRKYQHKNKLFKKHFKYAGLFVESTPDYYVVIGTKKGGVVKIFNTKKRELIYDDCGIVGKTKNILVTTQWLDNDYECSYNKNTINISGNLHKINFTLQTPFKTIMSRHVQLIVGKSNNLSMRLKNQLRKKLITKSSTIPIKFQRKIKTSKKRIDISTKIGIEDSTKLRYLSVGGKFSFIYIPSTRYFSDNNMKSFLHTLKEKEIHSLNENKEITFNKTIKI